MRKLPWAAVAVGVVAIVLASHVGHDLFAGRIDDSSRSGKASGERIANKGSDADLKSAITSGPALPVARVVMFNSGVAYFERHGEIEGDVRIDLSFSVGDINDLIKSLVVRDLDGGTVRSVSFDSLAPVERTLRSFAIDLSDSPSYADILNQKRGERIEIVLQQSSTTQPGTLTGAIIGIEKKEVPAGKDTTVEVEHLSLLCAEGMRSVKLDDVQRVRFLNPVIESELKKALDTMAQARDTQKKVVSLVCMGKGKRRLRVGYVAENPIWKTSYRLVLDPEKAPFLQGWALVENNSDEDWNKVAMSLISGKPISFQMDLYDSLYVQRPVVEPEQYAALRSPNYGGILRSDDVRRLQSGGIVGGNGQLGGQLGMQHGGQPSGLQMGGLQFGGLQFGGQLGLQFGGALGGGAGSGALRGETMDLEKGINSVASGAKTGDFFQYRIDDPVTLARQKSAMLPIVNQPIEGTRVSVYNEAVNARFPLLSLKIKNNTKLHLNHGPMTVFDADSYAGDAHIPSLQPGEQRLISYAVDLGTTVEPIAAGDVGKRTAVKIAKGVVQTHVKLRTKRTYTITNRSEDDRTVIVEHPLKADFHLVETDKPMETTSTLYRFKKKIEKGKTVDLVVFEERDDGLQFAISNANDDAIQIIINDSAASREVKESLQTALAKKLELSKAVDELNEVQRDQDRILAEQPRLRENLRSIPQSDPLSKRILEKLNQQETAIEKHEAEIKKLTAKADQKRKDLEAFLLGLNIDN